MEIAVNTFAYISKNFSLYKKIIQYVVIVCSIGLIGFVYYKFSKENEQYTDAYLAIPSNMSIVLEVRPGNELKSYMPWFNELSSYKNEAGGVSFNPIGDWTKIIGSIDSLKAVDKEWSGVLAKSKLVLASPSQLRADYWVLSLGLTQADPEKRAKSLMLKWTSIESTRDFKEVKIYITDSWQFAVIKNCLVIATSNALMEDVIIRATNNDVVKNHVHFKEAYESKSADVPLNFFFKVDEEEWLQLDPVISEGIVSLSGYAVLNDHSMQSLALTSEGGGFRAANKLPANTVLLDAYSYRSFEEGWRQQEKFYESRNESKFWQQAWKNYGDTCSCDLNDLLINWRGSEWGSAIIELNDSVTSKVVYISTTDSTDVISKLKPLLRNTSYDAIFQLRYPQLMERNQPQTFLVECNYVMQVGEMVFFANTAEELLPLSGFAKSLGETENYKKSLSSINSASGRLIYQSEFYNSPLPASLISILGGNDFISSSITRFKHNKFLIQILMPNSPETLATVETDSIGTSNTELLVQESGENEYQAWKVVNHNTKEGELLKQTEQGELSLADKTGKALWKRQIEGAVIGEIAQIDALKNNKLQYAFTTEKALYIIDRNGKDLKGFPIKAKPPITSPLHVADYDKDKKYRLLFTAGDGFLHNYNVEGVRTTGWKGNLSSPRFITDIEVAGEDYLFTINQLGKMFLLNRIGETKKEYSLILSDYDGKKCHVVVGENIDDVVITYTTSKGEVKTIHTRE